MKNDTDFLDGEKLQSAKHVKVPPTVQPGIKGKGPNVDVDSVDRVHENTDDDTDRSVNTKGVQFIKSSQFGKILEGSSENFFMSDCHINPGSNINSLYKQIV